MRQLYTLRPFEARLLQLVVCAPDMSATAVARTLRCRSSAVAYALRSLRDDGIIVRRPIINYAQLGFINVGVYFSLRSTKRERVDALLRSLARKSEVAWLGSLAGAYQYGMAVLVPSLSAFGSFLREIGEKYEALLAARVVVPRLAVTHYPRFAIPKGLRPHSVITPSVGTSTVIDALDHVLLQRLTNDRYESIRDLARQVSASSATVERRVARLEREGVIVRWIYAVDTERLGYLSFRLFLSTPHFSRALEDKLQQFCANHPAVTMLIQCIGNWDYEIEVEVTDPKDITEIGQQFLEAFEGIIEQVQICSQLTDWKFTLYPFAQIPDFSKA